MLSMWKLDIMVVEGEHAVEAGDEGLNLCGSTVLVFARG